MYRPPSATWPKVLALYFYPCPHLSPSSYKCIKHTFSIQLYFLTQNHPTIKWDWGKEVLWTRDRLEINTIFINIRMTVKCKYGYLWGSPTGSLPTVYLNIFMEPLQRVLVCGWVVSVD